MNPIKQILLGSAAALIAGSSAQAADLPVRKAAPAEYVRVCDIYGAGFFYIPGSETCLRISGMVRAEYAWTNTRRTNAGQFAYSSITGAVGVPGVVTDRGTDSIGIRARGRVNFDARTQTSWGTLRSYFRLESWSDTGYLNSVYGGPSESFKTRPTYAFIQFAGITAGRAQSFFDFMGDAWSWGTSARQSDNQIPMLAYTATFGGGFSATLALEDPSTVGSFYALNAQGKATIPVAAGVYAMDPTAIRETAVRYPDVVGAMRVDQGWGSAQLSGAFGRREVTNTIAAGAKTYNQAYNVWAVQGGVQINLPMLAAGDQLWIEAAYAKGQIERLGGAYYQTNNSNGIRTGFIGNWANAGVYAAPNGFGVNTGHGWNVMAALQHYWSPSLRSVFAASYVNWSNGAAVKSMGFIKGDEWRASSQLIWSPVKETDIGVEVLYAKAHNSLSAPMAAAVRAAGLKKDPDSVEARLRIQRGF